MKTKLLIHTTFILSVFLVIGGIAAEKPLRIRPIVHINSDIFEGGIPTEVLCLVVESLISNDTVTGIWVYHIRNYSEALGFYTTYYGRDPFWDLHPNAEVKPYLGEWEYGSQWGYPDFGPPYLVYGCTPPIKYAYHVVIHDEPRYFEHVLPEDLINNDNPIAWAKTVNAISQPVNWWNWTQGGGFEFYDQFPYSPIPNFFNNFPPIPRD